MMYIKIPTQYNDCFCPTVIERKRYYLRFTHNIPFDYWSFGIYDEYKNPITVSMRLVPNYPLNHYCKTDNSPNGVFAAVSYLDKDTISTEDIQNGYVQMVYVPLYELGEYEIYEL